MKLVPFVFLPLAAVLFTGCHDHSEQSTPASDAVSAEQSLKSQVAASAALGVWSFRVKKGAEPTFLSAFSEQDILDAGGILLDKHIACLKKNEHAKDGLLPIQIFNPKDGNNWTFAIQYAISAERPHMDTATGQLSWVAKFGWRLDVPPRHNNFDDDFLDTLASIQTDATSGYYRSKGISGNLYNYYSDNENSYFVGISSRTALIQDGKVVEALSECNQL